MPIAEKSKVLTALALALALALGVARRFGLAMGEKDGPAPAVMGMCGM